MQQLGVQLALVRLVAHGQIQPGLFIHDGFEVGEGFEAFSAVVRAHAAFTNAAKAHGACCKVNDHVVDATTAIGQLGGDPLYMPAIFGEEVWYSWLFN